MQKTDFLKLALAAALAAGSAISQAQEEGFGNHFIPDNMITNTNPGSAEAGSCASPDGPMNQIAAPPPNYAWLQANGYCKPGSYGKNGTVCWTFTTTAPAVDINSGWAVSGCTTVSFGPFTLYTCAPACAVVGTGLTFTGLTVGQCYTWCMGYSATGPPSCTFTDFCPYWMENPTLPLELLSFTAERSGSQVALTWETASEINTGYFTIERSEDGERFYEIGNASASGNSSTLKRYLFIDAQPAYGLNYYRLNSYNINGQVEMSTMATARYSTLSEVEVHPNPSTGIFHILSAEAGKVTVYDLYGKTVLEQEAAISFDLSGQVPGIYFVRFQTPEGTALRKVALK